MALDSVAERTEHLKSAAVYTAFPKDGALSLVRLSRWGVPLENVIPIDEQAGQAFFGCAYGAKRLDECLSECGVLAGNW